MVIPEGEECKILHDIDKKGVTMLKPPTELEKYILQKIRKLPETQKKGVLSYIEFLNEKSIRFVQHGDVNHALKAVEDTWGSIKLSKDNLKYIAEDKQLEYEI